MKRLIKIKLIFFLGLSLPLSLGLFLFSFLWTGNFVASATNVTVTGEVVSSAPVCGNSVIEAGENCESDSDCSVGASCNSSCQCQTVGGPCVPTTVSCGWGACVAGSQSGVCTNGCSSWPATQACGICPGVTCGVGQVLNESTCSCLPIAQCGNGNLDSGEECDDGNTVAGDCCSSQCSVELLISNVSSSPTINSANISWSTQCQLTQSTLEWGTTVAVSNGVASGLSGQNYNYNINGLTSATVYFFRITATSGSKQATYNGSFTTTGAVENCNNGIDDNNNGYCDYPASSCGDGSTPGDPACACSADFECTVGSCNSNGKQIVTCIDQTAPTCQPSYNYEQDCNVCEGVFCGPGQTLDQNTCTCSALPNVCGNGLCEPPAEDPYNCPQDCQVSCLSNWQCGQWQPEQCPESGYQARDCFDLNGCPVPINPPEVQRSCSGQCSGLTCGVGEQINLEFCLCEELVPFCGNSICESGENYQSCSQDCVAPCTPSWTCSGWSECSNGVRSRSCSDINNCGFNQGRPPETSSCTPGCNIACTDSQQIDVLSCACYNKSPYCGNGICEAEETNWSCATDCGLPPEFRVGIPECLDGIDNDGDGLADYPEDPGCESFYDRSENSIAKTLDQVQTFVQENILENPQVDTVNQQVIAPAIATAAAASTAASVSLFNLLAYARYLFTQPIFAFFRRRRHKWGVVYNSLTKQVVDLAIVRLYRKDNSQLVQSRVTDKNGRYNFLVSPGNYYLTVTKPGFSFPSSLMNNIKSDVSYLDLYYGATVEITESNPTINLNIPVDPIEKFEKPRSILIKFYLRKLQTVVAFSAVPISLIIFALTPTALTFGMLIFHIVLFVVFQRIAYQKRPKSWGRIYHHKTKKSVGRVITRIYDKQYNKLLETRVTDNSGRYSFLVGNNVYYVTAEKVGFSPYKSGEIDLINKKKEALVGMDIPLAEQGDKVEEVAEVVAPTIQTASDIKQAPEVKVEPMVDESPVKPEENKTSAVPIEKPVEKLTPVEKPAPSIFGQPQSFTPKPEVKESLADDVSPKTEEVKPDKSDNLPPANPPKSIFG